MDMFDNISAKDIVLFIFGLGGAWMFVKMSIKTLKDEIHILKKENKENANEIKSVKDQNGKLETNVAVILERINGTNDKIDSLYVLVESKTK